MDLKQLDVEVAEYYSKAGWFDRFALNVIFIGCCILTIPLIIWELITHKKDCEVK